MAKRFAASLTNSQMELARRFERAGLTTISQAVKAFERGEPSVLDRKNRPARRALRAPGHEEYTMTEQQAATIQRGDSVEYHGQVVRVESIRTSGIAAPYFRLAGQGLVSYRLCGPIEKTEPCR